MTDQIVDCITIYYRYIGVGDVSFKTHYECYAMINSFYVITVKRLRLGILQSFGVKISNIHLSV